MSLGEVYDRSFFADQETESYRSARAVLRAVWRFYRPTSVVDVGCGVGPWLRAVGDLGIDDYAGIDGDHVPVDQLWIPADRFVSHDLTTPLDLGRRFDLAVSVEVAEHLPATAAPSFVRTLTALAPVVLFSAAIPNQGGDGHLNEQWPDYWATLFSAHGYLAYDCLRPILWRDDTVAWWYRQNVLMFTSDPALLDHPGPAGEPLALVHPGQIDAIRTRPVAPTRSPDPDGVQRAVVERRPAARTTIAHRHPDSDARPARLTRATIAVCTRNRAPLLERCLASLGTQVAEADEIEVLVVDNGSTDDTPDLLRDWKCDGDHRRAVSDPWVGLAHARNTALESSDREVVIFVDDDALTPPVWARGHLAAYEADARVGAAGGPVGLTWPAGRPGWISDELTQWFSALDLGDQAGPYPNVHGPYGTNMSVRRAAALAVGGFDPRFGRRGRSLLSSEERDLSRRLAAAGWAIHYVPDAAVVQQVLAERLTRRWLFRRGWAQGVSNARFDIVDGSPPRRRRLEQALAELRTSTQMLARRPEDGTDELAELVLVLAHAGAAAELVRSTLPFAGAGR